ncbi:MAG: SOS response-associated peptidase family protein [Methylobacter sp.]
MPHWAKDAKIGYKMINARAETVADKPAFLTAFKPESKNTLSGLYRHVATG